MPSLPWLPKSLMDQVDQYDISNTISSGLKSIQEQAAPLMQPIQNLLPQPPAMPEIKMPDVKIPEVPKFDLGRPEDWMPWATEKPGAATVTPESGHFELPGQDAYLGPQAPKPAGGTPHPMPTGQPAGTFEIDRSSPTAFLGSFVGPATSALQAKGYPTTLAPILAAIPMNEQGWQKEAPGKNYYGIKGSNPRTGATTGPVGTWEAGVGRTTDTFRAYDSPAESVADFLTFLETNPRYAGAVKIAKETGDPAGFIKAVHAAGYATDPAWSDKVLRIAGQVPSPSVTQRAAESRAQSVETGGVDVQGIVGAYKGVPYTFGGPGGRGQGLGAPTDCSGFVSAVWKDRYGLALTPHTDGAYNQLRQAGAPEVSQQDARPGDVVFYMGAGTGGAISHHMGIYAGNGKVLDDSVSGTNGVAVRDVGHAGRFVILRDPRVNARPPTQAAAAPPPIVPSADSGGVPVSPTQARHLQAAAASSAPTAGAAPAGSPSPAAPPPAGVEGPLLMRAPTGYATDVPIAEAAPSPPSGPPVRDDYRTEPTPPSVPPVRDDYRTEPVAPYDPDRGPREAGYTLPAPPVRPVSTVEEAGPAALPPAPAPLPASIAPPTGPGSPLVPPGSPYAPDVMPEPRADRFTSPEPTVTSRAVDAVTSAPGRFAEDVGAPIVRAIAPRTGPVEGVRGLIERDFKPAPTSDAAGRAFIESVRSAGEPLIRPVEDAVRNAATFIEQSVGAPPGSIYQAAQDVSNVLGPGGALPLVGSVRRGLGEGAGEFADDAGRAARRLRPAPPAVGSDPRRPYEMGYRVVDLDELIPSNTPGGAPNPAYPRELQPRSRERAASQLQIDQIARTLEPNALLTDAGRLDSGPPIIGPDNIVESGNGRVLAIGRAAEQHPERYAAYVEDLRSRLPEYGLPESSLAGVRRPVLVRERLTDVDRAAFAAEANNPGLLQMSSAELARADAARLSDDLIAGLHVGEDDTIATALRRADNREVIRSFVGAIPANERAAILDEAGNLSAQGMARLESALLMRTYGGEAGERIARAFIESADPILRNVENAVMASLPDVARAEALIRSGARDAGLSISEDVATAVEMLARLRTNGLKVSDYLAQGSLFSRETTPLQDSLMEFINANTRSARPLREALKDYASRVESAADPNQVDMFGGTLRVAKEDVLGAALRQESRTTGAPGAAAGGPVGQATGSLPPGNERVPGIRASGPPAPPADAGPGAARVAPEPVAAPRPEPVPISDEVARLRSENADLRRVVASVQSSTGRGSAVPFRRPQAGPLPRQERAAELAQPITLSDEAQVARIRLDKFPAELHDELLNAARGTGFGERLRRGVLTDDAVQTLAAEYAPTVDAAIQGGRRGRAYAAEEVVALRNLMVGQAERVSTLGRELADAKAAGQIDTLLLAQHAIEGDKLRALGEVVFGGAPAEAGRALRQFRVLAQSLEQDPAGAGLRYIRQRFGSVEKAEEVAARYQQMVADGADPVQLASFLRTASGDWLNRLGIIRYASMLSSTTTHMVNAVGNATLQGLDVVAKPLAAGIDAGRSAVTGGPREVFLSEIPAQLAGMRAGAAEGFKDAAFIMRNGFRPEDVTKLDYLRQGFGTNIPGVAPAGSRAANVADFIVEGPLRALAASDAIFRSTARGGHLAAEATAAAMKANGGRPASAAAVAEMMTNTAVMERAEALAARSVLQEPRALTNWVAQVRQLPTPTRMAIEAVMPFVRTPYNIVAQGVGMTPAGAVGALYDASRGKAPPRELADQLARSAIGTAVMGAAAWQYASGNLTGAYPESEAERSTLPPGWRPWSVKATGPDGQTRYVSIASLGPLAIPAAVAVIMAEGGKKGTAWDPVTVAAGIGQFAADQTFLRGIGDMAKALSEGGAKLENVTENIASSYTPHFLGGGALGRQIQQVLGMPQRDPHGAAEAILAQFPYTAEMVTPRRDVVGRALQTGTTGIEAAVAPYRAGVEQDVAVIRAFRRAGEGLPMQAPKKARDPMTEQQRELTPGQQDRWRVQFGRALREEWDAAGRPTDGAELRRIEGRSRDRALASIFGG